MLDPFDNSFGVPLLKDINCGYEALPNGVQDAVEDTLTEKTYDAYGQPVDTVTETLDVNTNGMGNAADANLVTGQIDDPPCVVRPILETVGHRGIDQDNVNLVTPNYGPGISHSARNAARNSYTFTGRPTDALGTVGDRMLCLHKRRERR